MAGVYPITFGDRIVETTTTTGTGAVTLAGALNASKQAFSTLPDQSIVKYEITDNATFFETGQGTYTLSGTSLSRDTVESSSNGGALVSLPAGSKQVYLTASTDLFKNPAKLNVQNVANVKAYGAKGNGKVVTDGAMSAASATLACTTSTPFVSTDIGKLVVVYQDLTYDCAFGAGANAAVLVTTISTFTDTGHVVLAASATVAVSNAKVWFGTDDTTAIQAAIDALKTTGGTVYFPHGAYTISGTLKMRSTAARTDYQSIGLVGDGTSRVTPKVSQGPWNPASVIVWASSTSAPMFQTGDLPFAYAGAFGVAGLRIENLAFEGNFLANAGCVLDRLQGGILRNVAVRALEPSGALPATVKTSTVATPTDTPTIAVTGGGTTGGGLAQGNYRLYYSLFDTAGESLIGPESADFNVPALATPAAPTTAASGSGATIPTGTYLCSISQVNASGETINSTDAAGLSVTLGQNIVYTLPALSTGAVSFNIYCSTAGGARSTETLQNTSPVTGATFTLTALNAGGVPALAATVAGNGNIPRVTTTAAPAGSFQRIYLTPPNGNTLQETFYPATPVTTSTLDLISPNTLVGSACGIVLGSGVPNFSGRRCSSGIHLHAVNDGRANTDNWLNLIEACDVGLSPTALRFTGDRFGNTTNVTHIAVTRVDANCTGFTAYLLESTDNVVFTGCYLAMGRGVGKGVTMMPYARSAQFMHLEAIGGMFCDAPYTANAGSYVWGYDTGNAEPLPVLFAAGGTAPTLALASGGSLPNGTPQFYKVEALDNAGVRIAQSAEATITPSGTNLSVTLSNYSVSGATSFKIWRGTTTNVENNYYFTTAATFTDTGAAANTGVTIDNPSSAKLCYFQNGNTSTQIAQMTAEIVCAAGTTARAPFNIPPGVGPTSPANGDIWTSTAQRAIASRQGGATITYTGVMFTQTANAVSNTKNTTVSLVGTGSGSMTLAANQLAAGKMVRIYACGFATTTVTSPALLTFFISVGGTTVCTSTSVAPTIAGTNVFWEMTCDITCRTIGASGTVIAQGTVRMPMTVSTYNEWPMPSTGTTTINTTGTLLVDFQCTQSNVTGAQTITSTNLSMEVIN